MDKICLQCGAVFDGKTASKFCPECVKIRHRESAKLSQRKCGHDKRSANSKRYYEKHKEQINAKRKEYQQEYYRDHKEYYQSYQKEYYREHKEQYQSYQKEYHHRDRLGSPAKKVWQLKSPDGEIYECHNLLKWLKEHGDLLDGTIQQAYTGITKIKYSMQGKRKNPCFQWKGWKLLACGEKSNEKKI